MKANPVLLAAAVLLAGGVVCSAQTVSWTGNGNGVSWGDGNNWSGGYVPGPANDVVITGGAGTNVVSSGSVSIKSIQCTKNLALSGGDFVVTYGASTLSGALAISGGASLTVTGSGASLTANGSTTDTNGSFYAYNGGVLHLPNLKYVVNDAASPTWHAEWPGSLLDLSGVTNIVMDYYEELYIEAYTAGTVDLHRLNSSVGALEVDAENSGSVVDLSGLTGRWKSQANHGLSLEAQTGASILIPNVTQLEYASLRVDNTGAISTAQLTLLTNVNLTVDAATPDFGRLTNIDDTSVTALEGGVARLTNVVRVTVGNYNPAYDADGTGSLVDLSRATNVAVGFYEVLYVEAYNGGAVDLHRLNSTTGSLQVDAENPDSLVDLSGLAGRWKSQANHGLSLEAQTGASILIPNVTQLEYASLRVDNSGAISTAQLTLLTNVNLTVDAATPDFGRLTNIDDTSVTALNGGVARLGNVVRVIVGNYNPAYDADGTGSLVDLSGVTNVTVGFYEVLYVEAYNGGVVDLHRLTSTAGALDVDAENSGSAVNLSGLTGRWKSQANHGLNLEAQTGASILIPNVTQIEFASLRLDNTGVVPTAQLTLLTNVILTVDAAAPNFGRLTNMDDTSVTALNGGVARLTNVTRVLVGNASPVYDADGAGSLVDLSRLTNVTVGFYEVLYAEAYHGGSVDLHRLNNTVGALDVDAENAGSVVDLSGLTGRWKSQANHGLNLEAQTGASILIPNVTQIEFASLRLDNTGVVPTAQLTLLTNVILTVDAAAPNFGRLTNMDDTSVTALNGGVARLTNVTRVLVGNASPVYDADGAGSLVDLSRLTNVTVGFYEVLYAEAYHGGSVDLHRLNNTVGALDVDAENAGSVVDLSGLTGRWKSQANHGLNLEARTGASILIPNVTQLEYASLRLDNTGVVSTAQLTLLTNVNLTVDASAPNFGRLTNIDDTSVTALNGGIARLTNVTRVIVGNYNPVYDAEGAGSLVDLSSVTNVMVGYYEVLYVEAQTGGKVDLRRLDSVSTSAVQVLADGVNSVVDLSSLSAFLSTGNHSSSLTAQNSGTIVFNNQAFLLSNVGITIPPGNPILPATLIASPTLTLYGRPWHSYWLEQRDTSLAGSPWVLAARVALTNAFQALSGAPPANTTFRLWEFVADPPILDLFPATGQQIRLILYGATNKTYQILSATNVNAGASWQSGSVAVMTNSFRIFPNAAAPDPKRFFRAKQL